MDDVQGALPQLQASFADSGLIAELSSTERADLRSMSSLRIGTTCALANGPQTPWWPSDESGLPFASAEAVLRAALAYYDAEFPAPDEDVVYSQDVAYLTGAPVDGFGTNLSYAQAAALLWAARQILPDTQIWPNVGHTLMLSVGFDVASLEKTLTAALSAPTGLSFDATEFPQLLIDNGLADGVVAQEYSHPGMVDFDAAGLSFVLQAPGDALPASSPYCLSGARASAFPWRTGVYLAGGAAVPTRAAVSAISTAAACM